MRSKKRVVNHQKRCRELEQFALEIKSCYESKSDTGDLESMTSEILNIDAALETRTEIATSELAKESKELVRDFNAKKSLSIKFEAKNQKMEKESASLASRIRDFMVQTEGLEAKILEQETDCKQKEEKLKEYQKCLEEFTPIKCQLLEAELEYVRALTGVYFDQSKIAKQMSPLLPNLSEEGSFSMDSGSIDDQVVSTVDSTDFDSDQHQVRGYIINHADTRGPARFRHFSFDKREYSTERIKERLWEMINSVRNNTF